MSKHVIVVGAGIVGIATALQLRLAGCAVTLLDRGEPAMETSYGNAGAFAVSDIIPLAEPGVLRKVPGWMFDPLGPLALRWRYLPSLTPWLLRFLAASRPGKVAELTRQLSALLSRVNADYAPLIERAGLESMWRRHGNLTLYRSEAEFRAAAGAGCFRHFPGGAAQRSGASRRNCRAAAGQGVSQLARGRKPRQAPAPPPRGTTPRTVRARLRPPHAPPRGRSRP